VKLKRVILYVLTLILFFNLPYKIFGQNRAFTKDDIRILESKGLIIRERPDTWKTKEGLIISGYDFDGKTRLEHIMKHAVDVKGKNRHGVFTVEYENIIILMDELWISIKKGELLPSHDGARRVYVYDTKKKIGYLGGREGQKQGFPSLKKVRLVLEGKTPRVVTFYPVK
jgi:hypothetical protein